MSGRLQLKDVYHCAYQILSFIAALGVGRVGKWAQSPCVA